MKLDNYKILFVGTGNYSMGVSPIIKAQAGSLIREGLSIDIFGIKGKGLLGYLKNIIPLRKKIKGNHYDIIHAHFSLSAFIVCLTFTRKPIVVSLMGSDVRSKGLYRILIKICSRLKWKSVIVKSKEMHDLLGIDKTYVIPNGVDFNIFKEIDRNYCKKIVGFDVDKKYIIFLANPNRKEKNYTLAKQAYALLNDKNIILKVVFDKKGIIQTQIPLYLNAGNVLLLTSLYEGSPNVIKEAMACNIPIVSTRVGDVESVIKDTKGCYLAEFNPSDVSLKLQKALDFGKRTTGRKDIEHLDSSIIAERIINVYKKILKNR